MVIESGVHWSLHPNRHHQITFARSNLKIHYRPPDEREIWHYVQANADHIRKAVDLFPRKKALRNLNTSDMIFLFNKTIKTIVSNYIPHETVTFDDRDPPWINKNVKQLILEKNEMYKKYVNENKYPEYLIKLNVSKTN